MVKCIYNTIKAKLCGFISKTEKNCHIPKWTWRWRYQRNVVMATVVVLVIYNSPGNTWLWRRPYAFSQYLITSTTLTSPGPETAPSVPNKDPLAQLDLLLGRWDLSRTFKTFDYAVVGYLYSELSVAHRVCLATQSSIESLREILKTAAHWSGPISLAIFVVGDEMKFLQAFVTWLISCKPEIYSRLVIHVVTSVHSPAVFGIMPDWARNCSAQPLPLEDKIMKNDEWKANHPYPQNILRNSARKNCQTTYVYMVDVDIVPSIGMAESLDKFLSTTLKCNLCAYVIPTYELDWSTKFPSNKSELLQLVERNLAVPFHKKIFKFNQLSSDLPKWEANHEIESNEIHISHDVTNYKLLYEPFYVALDTVPPHDERFLGYGFTRSTQVYEMFLLGYQFKVLSPVFTIHWGIQSKKRRWRSRQVAENNKKFKLFNKELYVKYGKDPLGLFSKRLAMLDINY